MKGSGKHISHFYYITCLLLLVPLFGFSQDWVGNHNSVVDRDIEVTVSAGLTSYYGDLSIYDGNYFDKLAHESGFALGIVATKRLTPQIGISGQLILGRIQAKKDNIAFESSLFEYNLHVRLDLIRLFSSNYKGKLNWEVLFGVGNFFFNSTKTVFLEGDNDVSEHSTRVPELVFFGGSGLSYRFNEKMSVGAELTLHQFQNDKIDITVKNNDFDYFTYLSFGFTYYIRSKQKSAPQNKARIAHSNEKLKPLK